MPLVDELFPTKYISAADIRKLKDPNAPFVIKNVVPEECIHPKTRKPSILYVVYFQGGAKKAHRIRKDEKKIIKQLGENTDEWAGKVVTFRLVNTQVGEGVRMIPQKSDDSLEFNGEIPE